MATPQLIGHLDADCFYVSAERVRFPHLQGVPAGVIGNQGACVIAKSYELKACGVTTGMPIWEAVPLCPDAVFLKRDFRWYEVLSRKMLSILQSVSPTVEYYSIDEFFFDASSLPQQMGCSLERAAVALQYRILEEVGVPVSLGISRSRTLAKLASDARKPFGCTVYLSPAEIEAFIEDLPVEELSGIGGRSRDKLAAIGIQTCGQFARAARQQILRLLTVKGEGLWYELHGEAITPILTERPAHQRISRGGSLGGATKDPAKLTAWVVRNVERLIEELDFYDVLTSRLVLWLEYKATAAWGAKVTLPEPTAAFSVLAMVAKALLQRAPADQPLVNGMHLDAEGLTRRTVTQGRLFSVITPRPIDRLSQLKAEINRAHGRFAIRSGDTLPLDELYVDDAHSYDICDVHGKMCF